MSLNKVAYAAAMALVIVWGFISCERQANEASAEIMQEAPVYDLLPDCPEPKAWVLESQPGGPTVRCIELSD